MSIDDGVELEYVPSPSNVNAESALQAVTDVGEENFEAVLALRTARHCQRSEAFAVPGTDYLLVRVDTTPL